MTSMRLSRNLSAIVALALSFVPVVAQQSQSGLPGGASALTETHGDWMIRCHMLSEKQNTQRVCWMVQTQANAQGQQVISVELKSAAEALEGTLVLPFGLAVTKPATFAVDEGSEIPAVFTTCIPAGCLVPVLFKGDMLAAVKAGKVLKIAAPTVDGQVLSLPIPLRGFSAAVARMDELTR